MARPKKDPAIRQKKFTDAAERLFFEKGYDSTSVQDVLKAVGGESLSPSVFYYYFPSKEDLFEATINAYVSRYIEDISETIKDESLNLSAKVEKIIKEIKIALGYFMQVQSYFSKDKGYSRQIYQIMAQNVFSNLIDPTQQLIEESIADGRLQETFLLKSIGTRRIAYLILYAAYSLFHKEDETNYLSNTYKVLEMLPLILENILDLPSGSLGNTFEEI